MKTRDATKVPPRVSAWLSGSFEHLARLELSCAAAAAICAMAAGCTATADEAGGDGLDTETLAQALHEDAWRDWGNTLADTPLTTDPTVCSNQLKMYFITARFSDQRYYVRSTAAQVVSSTWTEFKDTSEIQNANQTEIQFVSAPTCAMQYPFMTPSASTDMSFLLAGKSTDNKIYVVEGQMNGAQTLLPQVPTAIGDWEQVSSTTYTGSNGLPALASDSDLAVVTFLEGNTIYAHTRSLPYSTHSWSSRITGPALPTGVTASGIPAIIYVQGSTQQFAVMVRGVSGGTGGLYWVYFNGTTFDTSWTQAFIPYPVDSDPAMEYDGLYEALTVYFRTHENGVSSIMQTSVSDPGGLGIWPFYYVDRIDIAALPNIVLGAPRVVFGAGIDRGRRTVIARGYKSTTSVLDWSRSILVVEDWDVSPWEE